MSIEIKTITPSDIAAWDTYVNTHPQSTLYHLSGWKNVIEKTYGHKTYYLVARATSSSFHPAMSYELDRDSDPKLSAISYELDSNRVVGILPLVHLKHFLFGNNLISIPFFDIGGILADDVEIEKALLSEAVKLGHEIKAKTIELRHIQPLSWLADSSKLIAHSSKEEPGTASELSATSYDLGCGAAAHEPPPISHQLSTINYATRSRKVRMLLELPESSEILMKSFKSKLRSQIKKPIKEGLVSKVGGPELLDDFYKVFSINMRDLGSPLHPKKLIQHVLEEFLEKARLILVYKDDKPLACSVIVGFKNTLENPWASSLHNYSKMAPNMLLYWAMLEYACDNGYKYFDFGRSTPDQGTYRFKEQWGAKPTPLHWHYLSLNGTKIDEDTSEKSKFDKAIQYWQKLPVPVTKVVGPMIRKHIGL